jgi:hypothetical protein
MGASRLWALVRFLPGMLILVLDLVDFLREHFGAKATLKPFQVEMKSFLVS